MAFLVWKLPSGQTVDRSHFVCAIKEVVPRVSTAVTSAMTTLCNMPTVFSPEGLDPHQASLTWSPFASPQLCNVHNDVTFQLFAVTTVAAGWQKHFRHRPGMMQRRAFVSLFKRDHPAARNCTGTTTEVA